MEYLLYETRNKINGKIYVGCHETRDINDSYLGSGTRIRYAVKTYGRENFERITLDTFNNAEDMYAAEADFVNKEFVARSDTYNLIEGGKGGGFAGKSHDKETRKSISESQLGHKNHFFGKQHTKETKRKIAKYGQRPLSIDGVRYNSRTEAASVHDVSVMTIHRWLKSNKAQSI